MKLTKKNIRLKESNNFTILPQTQDDKKRTPDQQIQDLKGVAKPETGDKVTLSQDIFEEGGVTGTNKIKDIHIYSLKTGGYNIEAIVNGEKKVAKMTRDDVLSFNSKTDRVALAAKYFLNNNITECYTVNELKDLFSKKTCEKKEAKLTENNDAELTIQEIDDIFDIESLVQTGVELVNDFVGVFDFVWDNIEDPEELYDDEYDLLVKKVKQYYDKITNGDIEEATGAAASSGSFEQPVFGVQTRNIYKPKTNENKLNDAVINNLTKRLILSTNDDFVKGENPIDEMLSYYDYKITISLYKRIVSYLREYDLILSDDYYNIDVTNSNNQEAASILNKIGNILGIDRRMTDDKYPKESLVPLYTLKPGQKYISPKSEHKGVTTILPKDHPVYSNAKSAEDIYVENDSERYKPFDMNELVYVVENKLIIKPNLKEYYSRINENNDRQLKPKTNQIKPKILKESLDDLYNIIKFGGKAKNEIIAEFITGDKMLEFIRKIKLDGFKQDFRYSGLVFSKGKEHYSFLMNPTKIKPKIDEYYSKLKKKLR